MLRRRRSIYGYRVAAYFVLVLFLVSIVFLIGMSNGGSFSNSSRVPKLNLYLADGVTLEDLNSDKYIEYPNNSIIISSLQGDQFYEGVSIRGRGNMTWGRNKKPYRIKFSNKVDLLNMGKLRKWALLTYDLDNSLLRGDTGFYLAKMINPEYQLRGKFTEVSINGEEIGLYYVTPTVVIDKKVVDLRDPLGILIELDNAYGSFAEPRCEAGTDYLTVKDEVSHDRIEEALDLFCEDFKALQVAAKKGNYNKVEKIADVNSLAEYALFSEFMGSLDAYATSFFFYKDGKDDLIHAGPVWDFDATIGNRRWAEDDSDFNSPYSLMVRRLLAEGGEKYDPETKETKIIEPNAFFSSLMYDLWDIPDFQELVKEMYTERLHGKSADVISYIKSTANYIREAAIRNNELWGNGDFDDEVDYIIWWLEKRFKVFDKMYGLRVAGTEENDGMY